MLSDDALYECHKLFNEAGVLDGYSSLESRIREAVDMIANGKAEIERLSAERDAARMESISREQVADGLRVAGVATGGTMTVEQMQKDAETAVLDGALQSLFDPAMVESVCVEVIRLRAELAQAKAAMRGLLNYSERNRRNWQSEKADDYIRLIRAALETEAG